MVSMLPMPAKGSPKLAPAGHTAAPEAPLPEGPPPVPPPPSPPDPPEPDAPTPPLPELPPFEPPPALAVVALVAPLSPPVLATLPPDPVVEAPPLPELEAPAVVAPVLIRGELPLGSPHAPETTSTMGTALADARRLTAGFMVRQSSMKRQSITRPSGQARSAALTSRQDRATRAPVARRGRPACPRAAGFRSASFDP